MSFPCNFTIIIVLLFLGAPVGDDQAHSLAQGIKGLQITSGSRTYRIPSPTRPSLSRNSFQQQESDDAASIPSASEVDQSVDGSTEKGFYISFDSDATPKRPKPPLRVRKSSPKKVCVNRGIDLCLQNLCFVIINTSTARRQRPHFVTLYTK
jgi:hypothetical protein